MKILEQIRIVRECKGFSQAQLAEKIHVTSAVYGRLERGESELTVKLLIKIACALDIELFDLVTVSGKMPVYGRDNSMQTNEANNRSTNHFNYYVINDIEIQNLIQQVKQQNDLIIQKDQLLQQQAEQLKILHNMLKTLEKI